MGDWLVLCNCTAILCFLSTFNHFVAIVLSANHQADPTEKHVSGCNDCQMPQCPGEGLQMQSQRSKNLVSVSDLETVLGNNLAIVIDSPELGPPFAVP